MRNNRTNFLCISLVHLYSVYSLGHPVNVTILQPIGIEPQVHGSGATAQKSLEAPVSVIVQQIT